MITALVRAEEERGILPASETLGLPILLLLAGNETTTNEIGNAVRNLLSHPAELAKVGADHAPVPSLVEERLKKTAQGMISSSAGDDTHGSL